MTTTRRDILLGAAAFGLASIATRLPAYAQDASAAPEKPELMFGVGGKPLFYYLPLTIAERKGFFEEEGIKATINDFGGGAKSLQALIGGSVDVVTGAYEHTIRMQNRGQDIKAVCELGRFPGICIGVRKDLAGDIKTIADLKGQNVGVTAPGSSTSLLCNMHSSRTAFRRMQPRSSVSAAAQAPWRRSRRVKSPPSSTSIRSSRGWKWMAISHFCWIPTPRKGRASF